MRCTGHDHDWISKKLAEICQSLGLKLIDPKNLNLPGDILKEIIEYLRRSRLVVADVSDIDNANVYYEVGFVYSSYPKKLILVGHQTVVGHQASLEKRLPFDIATQRILPYDTDARKFDEFLNELEGVMKRLLVTV